MIPYIALLIVLIVAILFTVYKGQDGFFVGEVSWTNDTTVKEMMNYYQDSLDEITKLKDKIASAAPFDDESLTQEKLMELGLPSMWTREKGLEYEKPISTLLAKTIEQERKGLFDMLASMRKDIQSNKIKETMTLTEATKAMGAPENPNLKAMSDFNNMAIKLRNKRKAYIDEKLGFSTKEVMSSGYPELKCPEGRPPFAKNGQVFCRDMLGKISETPLTCPTGTVPYFVFEPSAKVICVPPTIPYAVDPQALTSGGSIKACKNGDMVALNATDNTQKCIPAIQTTTTAAATAAAATAAAATTAAATTAAAATPSGTAASTVAGVSVDDLFGAVGGVQQALKASKPGEIEKPQAPAPEPTPLSTQEMEDRIAKNVATQLKDSLLMTRATKNVQDDLACPYASTSNSTAQGAEYIQGKPHPGPDMSEYIRKDSIPCWNCSLP